MWKQVILYTLSGFTALVLVFMIVFSNEISSLMYPRYPDEFSNTSRAQELWETTFGKQFSLLKEKIALCHLRGGQKIQINAWHEKPPLYSCILPYSDQGKSCHSSNDCQGACVVFSPKIGYKTFLSPSEDPVLKKFNCIKLEDNQKSISEVTYQCEKSLFKAQCAAFSWDQHNQWIINNDKINYIEAGQELGI